jgi:hypothetical protein
MSCRRPFNLRFSHFDGIGGRPWPGVACGCLRPEGDPQIATNFALLQCTGVSDVVLEKLTIDGNKEHNEMLDKAMFVAPSASMNRITLRRGT